MDPRIERVHDFIVAHKINTKVQEMKYKGWYTPPQIADYLKCDLAQVAKTLVLRTFITDVPIYLIASSKHQVDLDVVAESVKVRAIPASPDYIQDVSGFSIGATPPVALATNGITLIDTTLQDHDKVYCSAGAPHCVFAIDPVELARVTGGLFIKVNHGL